MNLIKCANGHFYDASKFQQCPHCNSYSNQDMTVPVNDQRDQATVPANDTLHDVGMDDMTMPINPAPAPAVQLGKQPDPIPDIPQVQQAILPPPMAPVNPFADDDDDQKTIGVYKESIKMETPSMEPVVGWVVAVNGGKRGQSMQLKAGRNFIGRGPTNDVVLSEDKTVSREKHAILVFEPRSQRFLLQPGTSKELFYVNDNVVLETREIKAYDVLYIGKTKLVFVPFCGEMFNWEDTVED